MKQAIAFLLVALSACSSHSERNSEIASTKEGVWARAYVTVTYGPSFWKNGHESPAHVEHVLMVEGAHGGSPLDVILGMWQETSTDKALFNQVRNAKYAVKFASDGHAIAVSSDVDKSFTIFDLTPADEPLTVPFYCPHTHFDTLEPWPDIRKVVLEVLDEASGAATTHHHDESAPTKAPIAQNRGELLDASLYACKLAATDPEMQRAVIDAYVSPWKGAEDSRGGDNSTLGKCIGAIALRDSKAMDKLRAAASSLTDRMDSGRARHGLSFTEKQP